MSLLDVNLDDAAALKILPNDTEEELRIVRVEIVQNKKNPERNNLHLVFESANDPLVDDIHMYLPIPADAQRAEDPKGHQRAVNRFTDFCNCFGVRMPCEEGELVGLTGWCLIGEEPDFRTGEPRNTVRRFQTGS
jgi:hypothetical protein